MDSYICRKLPIVCVHVKSSLQFVHTAKCTVMFNHVQLISCHVCVHKKETYVVYCTVYSVQNIVHYYTCGKVLYLCTLYKHCISTVPYVVYMQEHVTPLPPGPIYIKRDHCGGGGTSQGNHHYSSNHYRDHWSDQAFPRKISFSRLSRKFSQRIFFVFFEDNHKM